MEFKYRISVSSGTFVELFNDAVIGYKNIMNTNVRKSIKWMNP